MAHNRLITRQEPQPLCRPFLINSCKPHIDLHKPIVLIDDDALVRFNWKRQGSRRNFEVHTFDSFGAFYDVREKFTLDTPVFIDSNLGSEKGELLSAKLIELGFTSVYLTTGFPKDSIQTKRWVKDIVCKSFDSAVLPRMQSWEQV